MRPHQEATVVVYDVHPPSFQMEVSVFRWSVKREVFKSEI